MKKLLYLSLIAIGAIFMVSCRTTYTQASYDFPDPYDTTTRPTEQQHKTLYDFSEIGVYADNLFDGARLNKLELTGENKFTATILPENTPINPSPWYAFRLWSDAPKEIKITLDYLDARHRYAPKTSSDRENWTLVPTENLRLNEDSTAITITLQIGPDITYLAGQELKTSQDARLWCEQHATHPDVGFTTVGKSVQDRPLYHLDIGGAENAGSKEIILIFSRQHPPEVTGYLAMEAFVAEILADNKLANDFRREYRLLVFPMLNPDGVDQGHWRHNVGGVDLNRDWQYHHQPEIRQVTSYIIEQSRKSAGVIMSLDFHSTWQDIFYTRQDPSRTLPYFKDYWLAGITERISDFDPNDSPGLPNRPTSMAWTSTQFGGEGITYEVGDNTPRDFIKLKAEIAAREMMELLILR